MGQPQDASDRIGVVRQRTIALLTNIAEKARVFELPSPPVAMVESRRKLEENAYQVLVVGEAKRGKSSFVNALLGRSLLPTDVAVATSQVFRISQAGHEAYRLRFEDGSSRDIGREDLSRYGSQVVADERGAPRLDQTVRWIEVDAPIRFLPPGLSILDTPGLGSLYAAHAQVTHRFVPHADAVIFVLDSSQPMGQPDIDFLHTLLTATRGIFFIQTKIDQHRHDHWQEVMDRNREILVERFGDRLPDPRIWPISSHHLLKAAETGDDDYIIVSRHQELAVGLRGFLFRVAGWTRASDAVILADHYHETTRGTLAGRLTALTDPSASHLTARQEGAIGRKQQFETDWGPRGEKQREVNEGIRRQITIGRQSFGQALRGGGDIALTFETKIEAVSSPKEAEALAETMPGEVAAAAIDLWVSACEQVQARCVELLGPLAEAAEALRSPEGVDRADLLARTRSLDVIKQDRYEQFKGARSEWATITSALGTPLYVVIALGLVAWPVALAAGLGAGVWGLVRGWKSTQERQVRTAQGELRRYLGDTLQQVQRYFLDAELAEGRFSLVDEHFNSIERTLTEQVRSLVTERLADAQAEIDRLADAARLDAAQRQSAGERVREQLADWDELGVAIESLVVELTALDQAYAAAPAGSRVAPTQTNEEHAR